MMPPPEPWQEDFFRALSMPLRGASRRATELNAVSEGHPTEFFMIAAKWIRPGTSLSEAELLELYHRQYWYRLLDSLAEDFPVLRRMAGDVLFWDLIERYLLERPSRSFTLRHLGEGFAGFLEHCPLLDERQRTWFGALAAIEYAQMESFEALQCALPRPEDLEKNIVGLQEHLRLINIPVPAHLCHEWEDFSTAIATAEQPVCIAVWRHASGRSEWMHVAPDEATFLTGLRNGVFLMEYFDTLSEPHPEPEKLSRWFAAWQSRGWLGLPGKPGQQLLDKAFEWQDKHAMSSQAMPMR
jgi:hypothetical protein